MATNNSNVTEDERLRYLESLQDQTTLTMIPAMIFLLILASVGLVGNSLVIFVYSQKFESSPTRILIISLAVFDIVANVIAIPGEIYDMFHIWDFDNPAICKARLFFSSFVTLSSAMGLLALAIVRYRKVCHPNSWRITVGPAKLTSVLVASLGLIFSIPYGLLNGRKTKLTPRPDIMGHECTTDDSYEGTYWPLLNYFFFLLLFTLSCGSLTILYILIGVTAWKQHKKTHRSSKPLSSPVKAVVASPHSISAGRVSDSDSGLPTTAHSGKQDSLPRVDTGEDRDVSPKRDDSSPSVSFRLIQDKLLIHNSAMGDFVVDLLKIKSGGNRPQIYMPLQELDEQSASNDSACGRNFELYMLQEVDNANSLGGETLELKNDSTRDPIENIMQDTLTVLKKSQHRSEDVRCNVPCFDKIVVDAENLDTAILEDLIDITYYPNSGENDKNFNDDLDSKRLSFKITTTGDFLQNNAWLKNILNEVLSYKMSSSDRRDEELGKNNIAMRVIIENPDQHNPQENLDASPANCKSHANKQLPSLKQRLKRLASSGGSLLRLRPSAQRGPKRKSMGRTTVMLVIISAIYTLSFVPHLGLIFFKFLAPDSHRAMTAAEQTLYNLFVRTFFLNCAANPIIYSLCDLNFRKKCVQLFQCCQRK